MEGRKQRVAQIDSREGMIMLPTKDIARMADELSEIKDLLVELVDLIQQQNRYLEPKTITVV